MTWIAPQLRLRKCSLFKTTAAMRKQLTSSAVFICMVFAGASAFGQLNQLNGGGGAATNAANGGGQAGEAAGGTTQAAGGITGQTPGAAANQAVAGANAAQAFIGGADTDGFVGGGLETLFNQANRNFRALTQGQTPTGGTRNTSGTPRQVPVSLKIAFDIPQADGRLQLIERNGPPLERLAGIKPEFRNVSVTIDAKGVATLTGNAPNAAVKRLATNIVRLRPGVRSIQNNLVIKTQLPQ